jgi:predicted TIM-barrel fold metal-dependent hydrolase
MPLQDDVKIISVAAPPSEHERVWTDRLPKKYREVAPHMVHDGRFSYWVYEDRAVTAYVGLGAASGLTRENYTMDALPLAEVIPGAYDPAARLKDMDIDGVWAQVCFPSFPRFAGTQFMDGRDRELAMLCVKAYNDFVVDEWCAAAPERFIPLIILPLWDAQACAAEIERMAGRGAKSISFPENPAPLGLPSVFTDYWDPVFAAAQAAKMPLSMHFGSSGRMPYGSPDAPGAKGNGPVQITLMGTFSMNAATEWVFAPTFHKFPGLKVALSEGGIGWIPWLKERLDYVWERQRYWTGLNAEVRPSELFDRHVYGCFIDDVTGVNSRHEAGINNIMLESDYPHSDSTWPHTRKRAAEVLAHVPDDEARRIAELNARDLYSFYP